ncbi:MAG TPA: serine hydrolase, partial [Herpetosiphonaceae bacterium]
MTAPDRPPTAAELGLMAGFPPPPDKLVTRANQFHAPFNRWSFQNEEKLNPGADVWRGDGPVAGFEAAPRDLDALPFETVAGGPSTFGAMIERSYTDAIAVVHRGAVIYERYLNGMQPQTRHAWASGSKSVTGTLAALLAAEGLIDPAAPLAEYVPELAGGGFAGATVRQLMDMTTALAFSDDYGDERADTWRYTVAMGLLPPPGGYAGPANIYEFLPTLRQDGAHGERFAYVTPNTDALAWVIRRATGRPLAELLQERIWEPLGAERDALWLVDAAGAESAGSGLVSTLRDMARFGQLMLQRGAWRGRRLLPEAAVADIEAGGDREAFARSAA